MKTEKEGRDEKLNERGEEKRRGRSKFKGEKERKKEERETE